MAMGELLDYKRHFKESDVKCAVLTPERPSEDLEKLLSTLGFAIVWRQRKNAFCDNADGTFV